MESLQIGTEFDSSKDVGSREGWISTLSQQPGFSLGKATCLALLGAI